MSLDIMNPTCVKQVNKTGTFGIIEADKIDNSTLYNADSDFWGIFGDDRWVNLGNSPSIVVNDPFMVEWGGRLYFGVGSKTNDNFKPKMYEYDITTNTWATLTNLGITNGIKDPSYCVKSGDIYLYGGYYKKRVVSWLSVSLYKYNIQTQTTTTLSNGPFALAGHTSTLYGDDIYVFGGEVTGLIYKYNIPTNTWGVVTDLSQASIGLFCHTATLIGDSIYFQGGYLDQDGSGAVSGTPTPSNRLLRYDILTDTWTELTPGPYVASGCSAVIDGNLYITGNNIVNGLYKNEVWMYNTNRNIWVKCLSGGVSVSNKAGYTQVGNKLYMFGGSNPGRTNNISSYDIRNVSLAIRRVFP